MDVRVGEKCTKLGFPSSIGENSPKLGSNEQPHSVLSSAREEVVSGEKLRVGCLFSGTVKLNSLWMCMPEIK